MSATPGTPAGMDLDVLDTVAEAIESGAGLFEVVRAASRALDANLALLERGGKELAVEVEAGGSVVVARAHPLTPVEDGWRRRLVAVAESAVRAVAPGAVAVLRERGDASGAEAVVLLPGGDEALAERAGVGLLRGLQAGLTGFTFALGRSRVAGDPLELPRAADEALLAANVAETSAERPAALA